jgi:hypothetical protein
MGRHDSAAPVPLAGARGGADRQLVADGIAVRHTVLHGAVFPGEPRLVTACGGREHVAVGGHAVPGGAGGWGHGHAHR